LIEFRRAKIDFVNLEVLSYSGGYEGMYDNVDNNLQSRRIKERM